MNSLSRIKIYKSLFFSSPTLCILEGFLEGVKPYIRRVFTVIIFIGAFRFYLSNIQKIDETNHSEFFNLFYPILISSIIYLSVTGFLDQLQKYVKNKSRFNDYKLPYKENQKIIYFKLFKKKNDFFGFLIVSPAVFLILGIFNTYSLYSLIIVVIAFIINFIIFEKIDLLNKTKLFSYSITSIYFVLYVLISSVLFFYNRSIINLETLFLVIMIPRIYITQASRFIQSIFSNDPVEGTDHD